MRHRYMLDTNTISHLLKKNAQVAHKVVGLPMSALCISVITEGELLYGLAKRPDAKRLHTVVGELLRRVDVLPWNSKVAERYGTVRAALQAGGRVLAPLDLLIASHALAVGAVLVTNDSAFAYVDQLEIEDWTKQV